MPAGLAELLHDATVLHRFVEFIEEFCKEQERTQTYADASGLFFQYVELLAAGIKLHLKTQIQRAKKFPKRLPLVRANIFALKNYLRRLHALIKPAADAHTLSIPAPLIELASKQLQSVDHMRGSRIVILLTPEFMYFQRPHTDIKDQAQLVQSFIPSASFPSKLGFIELPYSQGPNFFTNLAIYHEIGHFVYEELSNTTPIHAQMAELGSAVRRSLKKALRGRHRDPESFAIAVNIMEYWIQEIFCDLFAIRLIGPAFSFAFVEMLGMLGFLAEKQTLRFNPTHPAVAFRLSEHLNMLRRDSWWQAIDHVQADQKTLLETLASIPRSKYEFYIEENATGLKELVDGFLDDVVPAIRKLVVGITPDPTSAVNRFRNERLPIENCLKVGVVPHKVSGTLDPVSIINSACCFYLSSLPDVVKQFEGAEAENNVDIQSLWTKRLEMWTMKAIEDAQIHDRLKTSKATKLWSSPEPKS